MSPLLQEWIALSIVVLSVGLATLRRWKRRSERTTSTGCGVACSACRTAPPDRPPPENHSNARRQS